MEFFRFTGDEGSYRPPWEVRLFAVKENMFSAKKMAKCKPGGSKLSLPLLLLTISMGSAVYLWSNLSVLVQYREQEHAMK